MDIPRNQEFRRWHSHGWAPMSWDAGRRKAGQVVPAASVLGRSGGGGGARGRCVARRAGARGWCAARWRCRGGTRGRSAASRSSTPPGGARTTGADLHTSRQCRDSTLVRTTSCAGSAERTRSASASLAADGASSSSLTSRRRRLARGGEDCIPSNGLRALVGDAGDRRLEFEVGRGRSCSPALPSAGAAKP